MPHRIIDTECFRDYWLLSVLDPDTGSVRHFETFEGCALDKSGIRSAIVGHTLVGFNSLKYDLPMIRLALTGIDTARLKAASDNLIVNGMRLWEFERAHRLAKLDVDHIDLIEVAPGMASLKAYGGRMHAPDLQDLPLEPDALVSPSLRPLIRSYCENDLRTTLLLFNRLRPQIDLREKMGKQYGLDLRSKSDAQIAEAVLVSEVVAATKADPSSFRLDAAKVKPFRYDPPAFLHYQTRQLWELLDEVGNTKFRVDDQGVVRMPKSLDGKTIKMGRGTYRMGIGGLHSSEKCTHHKADGKTLLVDRDVASYYPAIILTNGLYPEQMGPAFLDVYRSIVQRRLEAKHAGDKVTADSLKITVNGSFGKLGSPYSALYAPKLLIQTTLTGQLALLMLIEMLEESGIPVVSANTDGIVIKCPRSAVSVMDDCVVGWELVSGFETEATEYAALYSRDVNNYIAVKPDGSVKTKGVYAPAGLQKNPQTEVVTDAVREYLIHGTPVEQTIRACTDVRRFLALRAVRGGAVDQDDQHLGRVVRWYYSTDVIGPITYASNGNQVPRSDGARPMMHLESAVPADLDYHWYTREALAVLAGMGVKAQARVGDLLDEVVNA